MNLEKSVGHSIEALRLNPYMEEVWVLDHPEATHRAHFFKDNGKKYSAKGVLVMKENNLICRTLPSMADMAKLKRGFGWKLESFYLPLYTLLGEIGFKRWLSKPDVREALVKDDRAYIKEIDPLWHSLLLLYNLACSEIRPGKTKLWDYAVITWSTRIRYQYRGKERHGMRKLRYDFSPEHIRESNRCIVEYRFDVNRKRTTLPILTLSRKYPLETWPNTKTFVALPENAPYLELLFDEIEAASL